MKYLLSFILGFGAIANSAFAVDNIVVIVNKKSNLPKLTHAQAKALFLGETRFILPGVPIELHDRDRATQIYKEFFSGLASMSPKQVTVHWSRKVFTGEAPPPVRDSGEDAAVIEVIKSKPEAINYIYEKNANSSVKIIYSLKDK